MPPSLRHHHAAVPASPPYCRPCRSSPIPYIFIRLYLVCPNIAIFIRLYLVPADLEIRLAFAVKVYEVRELGLKFERHLDSEIVDFQELMPKWLMVSIYLARGPIANKSFIHSALARSSATRLSPSIRRSSFGHSIRRCLFDRSSKVVSAARPLPVFHRRAARSVVRHLAIPSADGCSIAHRRSFDPQHQPRVCETGSCREKGERRRMDTKEVLYQFSCLACKEGYAS
ncbi:nucleolar protein 10 [Senna tora]|uniref:Nucleolar protein 10 n=1 Tax=Senna tora TaxID=362788 RepID=A0A834SNJ0_9FABA|nr:nucleolar protein 10 [Senna tora]